MERTGNITFSVIVPVYNVQAYLSACVKSVVEQAGPADWECILVDDGSTDACPAMCDAFAQLCPGVTVIHRSNGGLAAAPGYRWYVCRYLEQDESQGMDARPYPGPVERFTPGPDADPDYAARVARLYAAGHWAVWRFCIDREFLVKYNLLFWNEVRWAEDYPFDLVLAGACPKLYYLDVELVVYRANRAGSLLNAGLAKHFAGIAAVIHRFEKMFAAPDCPWTPAEQAEIWRRTANVFWPQARGAACRDAEVRAACAPGLTACKALWKLGDENTRPDWKLFAFLLNHFGPRFALWAAGLLKRK